MFLSVSYVIFISAYLVSQPGRVGSQEMRKPARQLQSKDDWTEINKTRPSKQRACQPQDLTVLHSEWGGHKESGVVRIVYPLCQTRQTLGMEDAIATTAIMYLERAHRKWVGWFPAAQYHFLSPYLPWN